MKCEQESHLIVSENKWYFTGETVTLNEEKKWGFFSLKVVGQIQFFKNSYLTSRNKTGPMKTQDK